ncbi:response regulator transcription factor [Candidatus Saccharibacteria bacterium]|jgi:two-component system OmpR family response regulator|nr:response regulator transcription factor [Candidatus Saccharibacteria bacterium]
MRLLIVEDDERIANAIREGLTQEGYAVDVAYDGDEGYRTALADEYDAMILDVMMPGMSGIEVCKALRQEGNRSPVLLLTAKTENSDIVEGLDAGADDYLAKPFSFDVLLARIRALLRRPKESLDPIMTVDNLTLDLNRRIATRDGQDLNLSSKEFAILEYLLRNRNHIISKEKIIAHVWDFDSDVLPNTVEVFITYLRNKIDKPFKKGRPIIETIRGFGYVIKDEA